MTKEIWYPENIPIETIETQTEWWGTNGSADRQGGAVHILFHYEWTVPPFTEGYKGTSHQNNYLDLSAWYIYQTQPKYQQILNRANYHQRMLPHMEYIFSDNEDKD